MANIEGKTTRKMTFQGLRRRLITDCTFSPIGSKTATPLFEAMRMFGRGRRTTVTSSWARSPSHSSPFFQTYTIGIPGGLCYINIY